MNTPKKHAVAGLGVDGYGGGVVDPTENVKALSEALSQRQDDLREANNHYITARLEGIERVASLRAEHSKEVRTLEADRLEKIRQVDVSNTAIAAGQQLAAIQALAATTTANADALRAAVATTATTIQNQTDRVVAGITDRISALEKSSYTGQGKSAVDDPAMQRLTELVTRMAASQNTGAGKSEGIGASWGVLIGAVGLIAALIAVGTVAFAGKKDVVYVPAAPTVVTK